MWLLTSRNRQEMCQRTIDACEKTEMTQKAIVFCDGCDYDLRLPSNWTKVVSEENIGIGEAMNRFFREHPDEPFYGWLADDFLPKSLGWDIDLSRAAGNKYIAYCNDLWDRDGKRPPTWITSAFAIGGDLVRAVGWFSPPGIRQAGIDSAWNMLGRSFGLMRYLPSTLVEHEHYKNGKRPKDPTDNDTAAEQAAWQEYIDGDACTLAKRAVAGFLG